MDLRAITNITTWGEASEDINRNFNVISDELKSDNEKSSLAKGFFLTLDDLKSAYPEPEDGYWAYVGSTFPTYKYTWHAATGWTKSEETSDPEILDLEGYIQSEYVSDPTKILEGGYKYGGEIV